MKKSDSYQFTRFFMFVSVLALMCMSITVRLHPDHFAPEKNIPSHQSSPDDQESDPDSSEDNEAGDENDSVLIETGLVLRSLSIIKLNLIMDVRSYAEHYLTIISPPPRS